jgi:hypothetical protein
MKVIFLKNHLHFLEGDDWEVNGAMARYLVRVGVAKIEEKAKKEKAKK